ncbi:hypothetical protein F5X68DRAFT_215728 [Plectosphaerella plurivora]|uniref:Uncharacterized protein n=1 Tax=Plectosphaerella plurivora TaxID=936078 RepID=A0A9P8V3K7_9PEZI|nr:hypothetical protein F5X68DRAFT_215728 [Plectosphaerella plurivora]
MACHQAHNIPWATVAGHFRYVHAPRRYDERTNIYPRFLDGQGKTIHYFINAIARNIASHADLEEPKTPSIEPLDPDTTLLTPDVVARLAPSLRHASKELAGWWDDFSEDDNTKPSIPPKYTKTSAFLRMIGPEGGGTRSGSWAGHGAFYSLELFKLLILRGEMPVLRAICTHPSAAWAEVWQQPYNAFGDQQCCGWEYVPKLALKAYLGLNLLLSFPSLWDEASGRSSESDYRNTKCYQRLLRECTMSRLTNNIAALPHRQFFGVPNGHFEQYMGPGAGGRYSHLLTTYHRDGFPYGAIPIDDFLQISGPIPHMPTVNDVLHVRWCLCYLGLPTEIAIEVMDYAGYTPSGRLSTPNDPLHPENAEELHRYFDYCWNILVRCEVMGRWFGAPIPWERVVAKTMTELLGHGSNGPARHGKLFFKREFDYNYDQERPDDVYGEREIFTFL